MVFAILLSGIGGASGYVAPMIIQRALDLAIPEKNERLLFSLVGMLVGIYLVSVIFTTIRSRIMVDVSQSIIYDIRKDLFAHLQDPDYEFLCTCRQSRKVFPELPDHRLDTVAGHIGFDLKNHHHALADALACAEIAKIIL